MAKKKSTTTAAASGSITQLQQVAANSSKMETSIQVDLDSEKHVVLRIQNWATAASCTETTHEPGRVSTVPCPGNTTSSGMTGMAARWTGGTPRLDLVHVKASKAPVKRKELQLLAVAAWAEAFGIDAPTETETKNRKKQSTAKEDILREQLLDDLRSSPTGVTRWNKLTEKQRAAVGHLRKVDLAGLSLANIRLDEFDLQNCNLKGADLQSARFARAILKNACLDNVNAVGAFFGGSKSGDASFRNADLRDASLRGCSFLRASFSGARMDRADFSYSDLRGADFSGARMQNVKFHDTKFDQATAFPAGIDLTESLKWAGTGKDPRLAQKFESLPTTDMNFDSFMKHLEAGVDLSRLKKSLKMLKGDRFQLFAEVNEDSVTGVVKSQTDATLVYSCRLDAEGTFACCTQNLNVCGGLRGALCKHLLVLIIGLAKAEELDPTTVYRWVAASKLQSPELDKDQMSEVFLKYKGAEAGQIDWRPTETVPEDFFAF